MKKINARKVITTVGIAIGSLLLLSIIYIKLLPLPANISITVYPIVLTTTNVQDTYIFEGRNTISCYDRVSEYNIDKMKYMPMPENNRYTGWQEKKRSKRLNVFQKIRVIHAANNLKRVVYTMDGAYNKYKTADTPINNGKRLAFHIDGRSYFTDIFIEGEWSNKYAALCDESLIDLLAATMLGCLSKKGERTDFEKCTDLSADV
mgnify:CR=1 FL=1